MELVLMINPKELRTAQEKGERVVAGKWIQHYVKPEVAASIKAFDNALIEAARFSKVPLDMSTVSIGGKPFRGEVCANPFPTKMPLTVVVEYYFPFNQSAPAQYRSLMRWHTERPDGDNLTKSVLDRLVMRRFFLDDAQVSQLVINKFRSRDTPCVHILIYPAGEPMTDHRRF